MICSYLHYSYIVSVRLILPGYRYRKYAKKAIASLQHVP